MRALILLLLFSASSGAEDFNNWYFDFFRAPVASKGKLHDATGKQVETVRAQLTGKEKKDGTEFHQSYTFLYAKAGDKTVATLVWTRKNANTYLGAYHDNKGNKVTSTLTLKDGKRFEAVSDGPEGARMFSVGRLNKEGKLISKSKMINARKQTILNTTSIMSQESAEEDEPSAYPDGPAAE